MQKWNSNAKHGTVGPNAKRYSYTKVSSDTHKNGTVALLQNGTSGTVKQIWNSDTNTYLPYFGFNLKVPNPRFSNWVFSLYIVPRDKTIARDKLEAH